MNPALPLYPPLVNLAPALPTILIPENTPFEENAHISLDKYLMAQIGAGYCADTARIMNIIILLFD